MLRWDDIDWRAGTIRIRRLKGSRMMAFMFLSVTKPQGYAGYNGNKTHLRWEQVDLETAILHAAESNTDLPAEWSRQREMLGFPSH